MPGFKESNWTDQEVGIAVGRGVLIIPVIRGLNPYGFISKYQGLNAQGKTIAAVAQDVFRILVTSPKTRTRMSSCLTETTLQSSSISEALDKLDHLSSVKNLPVAHFEKLRDGALSSAILSSEEPLRKLNDLLALHNLEPVPAKQISNPFDDDIPF